MVAQGRVNEKQRGILDPGSKPKWVGSKMACWPHKRSGGGRRKESVTEQEADEACLEQEDKIMVGMAVRSPNYSSGLASHENRLF